ncbi:MAG: alkaline phosphatase family protein, partial [Opitutaceae bacterium]
GTHLISIKAKANLEQIIPYTCPTFIGFPNTVSDAYRAAEFIKELHEFEKNDNFPNFSIMLLPTDHTSGTRPGVPTPRAAVADNDLALGQIVEAISKSKFWKETCIFVTEDDPQAGLDHVDGHRTVGMVISPYTKRQAVDSTLYTTSSMVRTIELLLGLPPMTQFDAAAMPFYASFEAKANLTPYTHVKPRVDVNARNGENAIGAQVSLAMDFSEYDRAPMFELNEVIWKSLHGADSEMPLPRSRFHFRY